MKKKKKVFLETQTNQRLVHQSDQHLQQKSVCVSGSVYETSTEYDSSPVSHGVHLL